MNYINRLQNLSYKTRVRILWGTAAIAAIALIAVWSFNLRSDFKTVNTGDLLGDTATGAQTQNKYVKVERISTDDQGLRIYFSIENPTDEILNFSPVDAINLEFGNAGIKPLSILNRQDQPFVQKILSHTTQFGILVFGPIEAQKATLSFGNLFFENSTQASFKETLELDLDKLNKQEELRS